MKISMQIAWAHNPPSFLLFPHLGLAHHPAGEIRDEGLTLANTHTHEPIITAAQLPGHGDF